MTRDSASGRTSVLATDEIDKMLQNSMREPDRVFLSSTSEFDETILIGKQIASSFLVWGRRIEGLLWM